MLGQEVLGNSILVLPHFSGFNFSTSGLAGALWSGAWLFTCEVGPSTCGLHRAPEAHCKDSPVVAVGFKIGDADREGNKSRHSGMAGNFSTAMTGYLVR